jgi:uncharacterized RmlC-like cupin family protein
MTDAFHPDLPDAAGGQTSLGQGRVHLVRRSELSSDTAQSPGMRRLEAVSGKTVGSQDLWTGQTHVAPGSSSSNHHHGASETSIYVVSGRPRFVYHDGDQEVALDAGPGDYVYVPPFVPHREENPDSDEEAVVVISRTTQEAIVVNLSTLHPAEGE